MEKKYLIVGMAVLLGVSLSFFGCDDSTKEAAEPSAAEKAATALAEKLGADFAEASGTTVTLKKSTSIADNVTVEAGVTLAVPKQTSAITLTVGTGKTLTVAEGGSLTVAEGAAVSVTGTYTLDEGATVTNNGTVTIKSGGVSKSHDNDNSAGATGFTVVETGGKAYFKENLFFGPAATGGGTAPNFEIGSGGTFSFNKTSFVIDGNVKLNGIVDYDTGTFAAGAKAMTLVASLQQLKLNTGSTLTIESGVILNLSGSSSNQVIVKGTGSGAAPKVVLEATATLWHYNGINFYNSSGTAFTWGQNNKTHTAANEETYTWDATLGSNAGGWKAGA